MFIFAVVLSCAARAETAASDKAAGGSSPAVSCEQLRSRLQGFNGVAGSAASTRRQIVEEILNTPGCGKVHGVLLQVQPVAGVNFYDYRDPVGTAGRGGRTR